MSVDREALNIVQPQLTAEEPSFEPLWDATRTRTPVSFGYRTSSAAKSSVRHLQPWGVVSFRGRWYVVGHDLDRGEPRVFRLSRVRGDVRADGPAGSFEVPAGTDLRALTQSLAPAPADRNADVLVRPGSGHGLRRHAEPRSASVPVPGGVDVVDVPAGWDLLEVRYGATEPLVDELLGYGADVIALSPPEVRDAVVTRLRECVQTQEVGL